MSNIKKRSEGGFTIIEVLIVLAIAGLIMLIVFLAVPALQRNSRNTQRKNDASAVASAVANFISNNGGTLPTTVANDAADANAIDLKTAGGTNYEVAKLGFYSRANVTFSTTAPTSTDNMSIASGYTCKSDGTALGTANTRSVAILIKLEPNSIQCVEQ